MVRYLAALLFIYLKQDIMETGTTIKFPFRDELIKLIQKELHLHSVYVIGMETIKKRQKNGACQELNLNYSECKVHRLTHNLTHYTHS